jgi:hypothetical protein
MTEAVHKFKVGQNVDLIPSTFRAAATGSYEIVRLRTAEDGNAQYLIKSPSEAYERVVSESDIVMPDEAEIRS